MTKYKQHEIVIPAGSKNGSMALSTIHGSVKGWATISDLDIDADIVLKDGANAVLEGIDVRVGAVLKANNFINAIVPLAVKNPGQLRADISVNEDLAEDYKVKVLLFFSDNEDINNCM